MKKSFLQNFFVQVVLAGLGLAVQQGCQESPPSPPISSWDCPRMLDIKKEWELLSKTARSTPAPERSEKYGLKNEKLDRMLGNILKQHLSEQDLRQLAATCKTLSVSANERGEFTNAVLAFMVESFVNSGDRDSLVKLLSTRCPIYIGGYDEIEFCLASRGKKLKDPILILGEAYSKCTAPEVRHDIAGAVRRGFAGLGIHDKDDAEFVKKAMQWYEKEKNHLTVNNMYWHNASIYGAEEYELTPELYEKFPKLYRRELLFKKTPPEK